MGRPFYAEYVNDMLRLYARVGRSDYVEMVETLDCLPEFDRNVIIGVYRRDDTLADNIFELSKELSVDQDVIWSIVGDVTKNIMRKRGML